MARTARKGCDQSSDQLTTKALIEAMRAGTTKDKIQTLKSIGILTKDGRLAPKYKNWSRKATRTPNLSQMKEP